MTWEDTQIEKAMQSRLLSGNVISTSLGQSLWGGYLVARHRLVEEILTEIKAIEGSLTDHGPAHIVNVLENMHSLLEKDYERIDDIELYVLCLLALFHDVGNIHGRKGHYDRNVIYKIYDYVRNSDSRYDAEKVIVAQLASAHSGKASDGSHDTINELSNQKIGFYNKGIDGRKLSAILRLADELAEGPQRTSNFMLIHHKYKTKSEIFHKYAKCKYVFIDKGNDRIALTYRLKLTTKNGKLSSTDINETKELLEYIYMRILKVNQERLYNKFYCNILTAFKILSVSIEFEIDGKPIDLNLKDLIITDLQVPGEKHKLITEYDKSYEVSKIISALKKK